MYAVYKVGSYLTYDAFILQSVGCIYLTYDAFILQNVGFIYLT